jgi:hypothetical protein
MSGLIFWVQGHGDWASCFGLSRGCQRLAVFDLVVIEVYDGEVKIVFAQNQFSVFEAICLEQPILQVSAQIRVLRMA